MNLNFSAYSFQYPIKPNLSPFSSVEGEKLNAFYSIPLYIKCVTAGNTLFPCLNYLSCYPFQKINVEKKKKDKERKTQFPNKQKK